MNASLRTIIAILAACAGGSAQAASESRALDDFSEIRLSGGIDLELTQGTSFAVTVETDDEDQLDEIVTEVHGATLHIHREDMDRFSWDDVEGARVSVTLPALEQLEVSGGSNVDGTGTLTGERLDLNASGGSDVRLEVAVSRLDVRASGGSDLRLSGSADEAELQGSGGSDLDARGLTAREAEVNASGGSDVEITVTEDLIATASGGSDVIYRGEPAKVDASRDSDITHR